MSFTPKASEVSLSLKVFLVDLQALCRSRKVELAGVFTIHQDDEPASFRAGSFISTQVECWGKDKTG